jgi:hypothetical protein
MLLKVSRKNYRHAILLTLVLASMAISISGISIHNTFADSVARTNSSIAINSTNIDFATSNSTNIDFAAANSTLSSELVSSNDTVSSSTNSSQTAPLAMKSWDFNNLAYASKNQIGDVNLTTNLSAFSISARVKPDYNHGSPQFTVISKENSFLLAINKDLPPKKMAVFSIFDGIRWNTITSKSDISEQWTHLVATFNGSSIALYVNGTLESSGQLEGEPTITIDGHLATKTAVDLSSNRDIVIGSYYDSIREMRYNSFSGNMTNINLYASTLSPQQISQLYDTNVTKLGGVKPNSQENLPN